LGGVKYNKTPSFFNKIWLLTNNPPP
jgi:hypothetical protein